MENRLKRGLSRVAKAKHHLPDDSRTMSKTLKLHMCSDLWWTVARLHSPPGAQPA
jgi:hypothetical protein